MRERERQGISCLKRMHLITNGVNAKDINSRVFIKTVFIHWYRI